MDQQHLSPEICFIKIIVFILICIEVFHFIIHLLTLFHNQRFEPRGSQKKADTLLKHIVLKAGCPAKYAGYAENQQKHTINKI
ncbi:hypothetical protein Leryth_000489 [Lithospermum erythrorhizon]|nr:hypothetical protein Leryth_000489 [Lithospermum erythrorhizon]